MNQLIGRVVATERRPNTTHEFHFWTGRQASIGIGSIVKVVAEALTVYGVVVEGFSYTDLMSPIHDYIGADADPAAEGRTPSERPEIRLYSAAVLRRVPEEPVQPVPMGAVHLASDEDVVVGLRMDSYVGGEHDTGIPLGLYTSGGLEAKVYVDADFLLGPEAAHLNITGVSGLATKTSLVEFLLASIFQHMPRAKGSVAAVCFNVKGPDLLFLDQAGELEAADQRMYDKLGIPAEPFDNVTYFAPYRPDGWNLNTLRTHPDLSGNVEPLRWGLKEVIQFSEVLLTREDLDAKADALVDFIRDRVLDQPFGPDGGHRVVLAVGQNRRFSAVAQALRAMLDGGEFGILLHLEANFSAPGALKYTPDKWRANRIESPGGALAGLAVHLIDLLCWLGGPAVRVSAQAKRRAVPVDMDDTTSALFEFATGATGYLGSIFACPYTSFLNVYGTEANAFALVDANELRVQLPGKPPEPRALEAVDTLKAELEEFAAACRGGPAYRVAPAEAIHNVAVMEAIVASAAQASAPVEIAAEAA